MTFTFAEAQKIAAELSAKGVLPKLKSPMPFGVSGFPLWKQDATPGRKTFVVYTTDREELQTVCEACSPDIAAQIALEHNAIIRLFAEFSKIISPVKKVEKSH
jgi:hypothetical protein